MTEENQIVLLQTNGQVHSIEVILVVDRVAKSLVVLFLDKERVVCLVDSSDVKLEIYTHQRLLEYVGRRAAYVLDGDEVRADKGDVVNLSEGPDNSRVIDTGNENSKQVGKERGLFLQVEREGLVVARNILMSM